VPDSMFLIAGQTKYGDIYCGFDVCRDAEVVNNLVNFNVDFDTSNLGVNRYIAEAFPTVDDGDEEKADIQAYDFNGNIYTCTLDLTAGVPDCIDFI